MAELPSPYTQRRPTPRFGGAETASPVVESGDIVKGQAISGVGMQVAKYFIREQAKADADALESKKNEYKRAALSLKQAAYDRRGAQVAEDDDYFPSFEKAHDQLVSDILNDNKNSRIEGDLKNWLDLGSVNFREGLINHATKEREVYAAETLDAANEISIDTIASEPYNDSVIDQERLSIHQRIKNYGKRRGWSNDQIENTTREILTKAHTEVISRMLDDGNVQDAEDYFSHYGDQGEIEGEAYDSIRSAIKSAGKVVRAQDLSDSAFDQFSNDKQAGLDWIRDNARPEERQDALRLLKTRYNEQDSMETEVRRDAGRSARGIYAEGIEAGLTPSQAYDQIPNSTLRTMDEAERLSLMALRDKNAIGTPVRTDIKTYFEVMDWIEQNPGEELDLAQFEDRISTSDLKTLRKEMTKDPKALRTKAQVIADGLLDLDIEPSELTKDTNDGEKARAFRMWVEDQLSQIPDYTIEDVRKTVRNGLIESKRHPNRWKWFRGERTVFETFYDEDEVIEGVPKEMVPELADLVARNLGEENVSDDAIRALYDAMEKERLRLLGGR